jgi:hypothetical protein
MTKEITYILSCWNRGYHTHKYKIVFPLFPKGIIQKQVGKVYDFENLLCNKVCKYEKGFTNN